MKKGKQESMVIKLAIVGSLAKVIGMGVSRSKGQGFKSWKHIDIKFDFVDTVTKVGGMRTLYPMVRGLNPDVGLISIGCGRSWTLGST